MFLSRQLFSLSILLLVLVSLAISQPHAEMINQPLKTKVPKEYQNAGANLLSSISSYYAALRAIEDKNFDAAEQAFFNFQQQISTAISIYGDISKIVGPGLKLSVQSLEPMQRELVESAFDRYKKKVPINESEALGTAILELLTLRDAVVKNLKGSAAKATPELLNEIEKVLREVMELGTVSAILLRTGS